MELAKPKIYTEEDYYSLPENIRAELIDGDLIYNQAAPSRKHQTILTKLLVSISNYIDSKAGSCHVYPAPFAVKLWEDRNTIVEPDISVIEFKAETYSFKDEIKVNIYDDLYIDFSEFID